MDKTPTADELINQYEEKFKRTGDPYWLKQPMIEFAKLHVKAALEAASKDATVIMIPYCDDHTPFRGACVSCGRVDNPDIPSEEIDKDSILNAYNINLIK